MPGNGYEGAFRQRYLQAPTGIREDAVWMPGRLGGIQADWYNQDPEGALDAAGNNRLMQSMSISTGIPYRIALEEWARRNQRLQTQGGQRAPQSASSPAATVYPESPPGEGTSFAPGPPDQTMDPRVLEQMRRKNPYLY